MLQTWEETEENQDAILAVMAREAEQEMGILALQLATVEADGVCAGRRRRLADAELLRQVHLLLGSYEVTAVLGAVQAAARARESKRMAEEPTEGEVFELLEAMRDEGNEDLCLCGGPYCRVCGCCACTPCPGGCIWAEADLCSRCVDLE